MSKAYIEVSQNSMVHNSSRPSCLMHLCHDFVTAEAKVKDAISLIEEYGVKFSHYVESIRLGRIAVYTTETDDSRVSIRLKKFSPSKLEKIHSKTH